MYVDWRISSPYYASGFPHCGIRSHHSRTIRLDGYLIQINLPTLDEFLNRFIPNKVQHIRLHFKGLLQGSLVHSGKRNTWTIKQSEWNMFCENPSVCIAGNAETCSSRAYEGDDWLTCRPESHHRCPRVEYAQDSAWSCKRQTRPIPVLGLKVT